MGRGPLLLLGPGASAGIEALRPMINALDRRGVKAAPVDLPTGKAERAMPAYRAAIDAAKGNPLLTGGHSFGGRVASLVVAEGAPSVAGLVLLSYPLHAPGRHAAWDERTAHWPKLRVPVLLLCGESDPFARIDLLRSAVADRLSGTDAELITYPNVGHGLAPVLDDAAERVSTFVAQVARG